MAENPKSNATQDAGTQISPHVDPALQPEHQHQHTHHHHTAYAEQGRQEEVVYTNDTAFEKGIIPDQTPLDHASKSRSQSEKDEETGESQPVKRPWHRRMRKHWSHVVHAVIWLLFTG
jgi:concentrative nucleoside transporter, CNT family